MTPDEYPTLDAYREENQLRVWCDHERQWHFHGACGGEALGSGDGLRAADCRCSHSPLKPGYRIREVGPVTRAVRAEHREWTGRGCPTCKPKARR